MTDEAQKRRENMLAAAAARRAAAPASAQPSVNPIPPPQPTAPQPGRQRRPQPTTWQAGEATISIVPNGTRPNPGGMPANPNVQVVGSNRRGQVVGGGRQTPRPQSTVVASPGKLHQGVRAVAPGAMHRGGVQAIPQGRTVAAPMSQARQAPAPVAAQSTAPVVDLSVILAYSTRPALVEAQQRHLLAQTVQPVAMVAWHNPSDRVRFPANVISIFTKLPVITPNVDMGPWFRWGIASQCATEYVAVLDDDCLPQPGWLQAAIERLGSAGEDDVICAAGLLYGSDRSDDVRLVGPEAPPSTEVEVDTGRCGWVMRTSTARKIAGTPRLAELLCTGVHISAVAQQSGGLMIVLPYGRDRSSWGMTQPPHSENSISARIDEEAAAGRAAPAVDERDHAYNTYRDSGWLPWCVLLAESAAAADTIRTSTAEAAQP